MANHSIPDLEAFSVEELGALITAAQAKRQEKMAAAKSAFVEEVTKRAEALGVSLEELLPRRGAPASSSGNGRKQRRDAGQPVAAKYRSPKGEEWSGRGRAPVWIREAEAAGNKREDFAI